MAKSDLEVTASLSERLSALEQILPTKEEREELRDTFECDETIDDIKDLIEPFLDALDEYEKKYVNT